MTFFDLLNNLFSKENSKITDELFFNDLILSNFLLQRWVSMESSESSYLINETSNKFLKYFLNDKDFYYKFLYMLISKKKNDKIFYIKKDNFFENNYIKEFLSKYYNISMKEVDIYLSLFDIDINNFKEFINID